MSKTSDDFLKVHYHVKRLTLRLIKSYNYRSYYLNSITVVLHFLYVFLSNEVSGQKFSKVFIDLDC